MYMYIFLYAEDEDDERRTEEKTPVCEWMPENCIALADGEV
jgi:hypothetical protein